MDENQQRDRLDKAFQEWRVEEDRFDKAFQELRAKGEAEKRHADELLFWSVMVTLKIDGLAAADCIAFFEEADSNGRIAERYRGRLDHAIQTVWAKLNSI
jgi:hypothetical protein